MKVFEYKNTSVSYQHYTHHDANKAALVLVHPLGMNQSVWDKSITYLSAHYHLITFDLPGHGHSIPAVSETVLSIAALSDLVIALAQFCGHQQFHYVGTSIGGAIGQELLLSHPTTLLSLMLTNTSSKIGDATSWGQRAAQAREKGLANMAQDLILRWFSPGFMEQNPSQVNHWQQALAKVDSISYALLCEALGAWEATTRFNTQNKNPQIPVCALAGSLDPAMPLVNMTALAALIPTSVPLKTMAVGHVPSVENPQEFNTLVETWLKHGH